MRWIQALYNCNLNHHPLTITMMKKILNFWINNWFVACLMVVFLIGFLLRFYKLGRIPTSLYWDETAMLVDAKSIAQTGRDMHGNHWAQAIFPSYGDYKLPVYIWLASASVKLFGANEFALRFPSAFLGTFEILLIGWFSQLLLFHKANKEKSQFIFLSASVIMALSPWSILFSRTGFEGFIGQFLLLCSMISLWKFFIEKKRGIQIILLSLSIFLGAISVYAYYSVRFVWPVIFIISFLLFHTPFRHQQQRRKIILSLFLMTVSVIGWWMLLYPLRHSPIYHASQQFRLSTDSLLNQDFALQSNQLRLLAGNGIISRVIYHRHILFVIALAKNYSAHFDLNFLFLTGDSNFRHGTGFSGLFQWWMIFPFFVGVYHFLTKRVKVFFFLFIWWMIALLPASVPTTVPHALRSLNALIPLVLIVSVGVMEIVEYIQQKTKVNMKYLVRIVFCFMLFLSLPFIHDYFVHYPTRSAFDWQDGYKQLALFVEQHKNGYKNVWINPDDDRLYLWLMAYGIYSGQDFQSWQSNNHQFADIENIHFQEFYWERLFSIDGKILVIAKPGQIEKEPNKFTDIKDSTGVMRFVAAEYSN